jgi:putative N6-adenine-specific DNA methylase
MTTLRCFAVAAPGFEPLVAAELRALGLDAKEETGGASWEGDLASVYRANLWLRTASRVMVRIAEFRARTFFELERHARKVAWSPWVAGDGTVAFRVTAKKSRLYHSDAVAQRLGDAIVRAMPRVRLAGGATADDDEEAGADANVQLFVVRVSHDVVTLSVDSSGALLHMRGYRQQVGKAPLRETLAAAVLLSAGWDGTTQLVDPLCGSGTLVIEGAMIARRMAPGASRRFAFQQWPGFDGRVWSSLLEDARRSARPSAPVAIVGSDRDEGAIAGARANAERAGVAADVQLSVRAVSSAEAPAGPGLVATNPPYGVRVGDPAKVRDLYAQLGKVLHSRFGGWSLAMLSPDRALERQLRLPLGDRLKTANGGIPVRVVAGTIPLR